MTNTPPKLKVFLCHASEDKPIVRELYDRLRMDGFDPWLDSELLVRGENWPLEIQKAMRASQAVIVCLSEAAIVKEGYIHTEIKIAQSLQLEKTEGTIFFITLQLEECDLPFSMKDIQWGRYFEPDGYERLVKALNKRAEQVKAAQGIVNLMKRPHSPPPSHRERSAEGGMRGSVRGGDNAVVIGKDANQAVIVPGSGNVINVNYGASHAQKDAPTVRSGDESTVVGGNIEHSIVGYNVTVVQQAPANGLWHRPAAPRPTKRMVGRGDDFKKVAEWLKSGKNAAITVTVQGTPGVGKTVLVEHLAAALDGEFPGGVIFKQLGVGFRDPILANPILEEWAGYAGKPREGNAPPHPDEVRTLLAGPGDLLVVLDDVWDTKAVQPLFHAFPKEAGLLVTTRSRRIAQELGGEIYPLDVLSDGDALELLKQRVHPVDSEISLLKELVKALGNHAQALDIAAGSLARLPHNRWKSAANEIARQVREGSGFEELHLTDDEEKESRVEAALAFSYHDLKPEAQKRFRSLGAFAPDASFGTEAAAGMWELEFAEEAENQLIAFVELGLLNQAKGVPLLSAGELSARWQQHSILRAYALALLKKEGEEEAARKSHARTHTELMREADDRQTYFLMLPDYPQLQHAFAWAIDHDLDLAQRLAGHTANLQSTFYLVRESYSWAKQLVEKSKGAGEEQKSAAIGTLGNSLSRLADLPGEDRRARLLEALQAYDETLHHYRPDTAPLDYAMTQGNLGYLHLAFIGLSGEDKRKRYKKSLTCVLTALAIFSQVGHAPFAQQAAGQLRGLKETMGANTFSSLWKELDKEMNLGELPDWLK